jgi:hypothetical protein
VRTNGHGCAAASAITPGNDDGRVNEIGFLVGEVGCQVGSVVGSNVRSSLPSYWDSPEAAKLFGFSYKNGDDVYMGLQQIVESLSYTQQSHDGYKRFVAHFERGPLTPKQIVQRVSPPSMNLIEPSGWGVAHGAGSKRVAPERAVCRSY